MAKESERDAPEPGDEGMPEPTPDEMVASALVPYQHVDGTLVDAEAAEPEFAEIKQGQMFEEVEGDVVLAIWAKLARVGGTTASNGTTFNAGIEFDGAAIGDVAALLGEQTYKVVFGKVECGEAKVKTQNGKADGDVPVGTAVLEWSGNQLIPWLKIAKQLGKNQKLELIEVNLAAPDGVDLTAKA